MLRGRVRRQTREGSRGGMSAFGHCRWIGGRRMMVVERLQRWNLKGMALVLVGGGKRKVDGSRGSVSRAVCA